MEIKYTIKIKDKQNPPTFDERLGKGIVEERIVDFKDATEDDLKKPMFLKHVYDLAEELKNEWFEVKFEIVP